MEDSGIIKQYSIQLDYKLLEYDVEAFILIKVFHGKLNVLLKDIQNFLEIKEA